MQVKKQQLEPDMEQQTGSRLGMEYAYLAYMQSTSCEMQGWMKLKSCGIGEDSWESPGQQGGQTNQSIKEINAEHSLEELMLKLKL